jgi:hypothetical protein
LKGQDFSRADKAIKVHRALQLAEKLDFDLFCNKGTTLVGPQTQQNKERALAPAAFLHHNRQCLGLFPQPV